MRRRANNMMLRSTNLFVAGERERRWRATRKAVNKLEGESAPR